MLLIYCIGIDILIYLLILFLEGPCLSCPGAPDVSMSWLVPVSVSTPYSLGVGPAWLPHVYRREVSKGKRRGRIHILLPHRRASGNYVFRRKTNF